MQHLKRNPCLEVYRLSCSQDHKGFTSGVLYMWISKVFYCNLVFFNTWGTLKRQIKNMVKIKENEAEISVILVSISQLSVVT